MARARLRTLLPLIVLTFACTDDDPTGIDGIMPDAYLAPNTGLSCASNCLTDDVSTAWSIIPNPPSGSSFFFEAVQDPTHAGGVVQVTYCRVRNSDNYEFGCYQPTSWWKSSAAWPTGKVQIGGREPSNITRVTFESFAPLPQVALLEYERPENPACSYGGSTLWCNGTYRLKVSLTDAGWYDNDRFYLSVEKADGTRWGVTDNTGAVSGETVTWTWTALPHAEPGSKLVITYYAWDGKAEGKQEIVLPLRDSSPTLTLDAREAPMPAPPSGGPAPVQIAAGTPVEFEAEAAGATLVEVLGWEWTPSDTTQMPMTGTCAAGVNPCEAPVYEAGTMEVTARVDGQVREALAPVGIVPELKVTAQPVRITVGTLVSFDAAAIGGTASNLTWRWNPDSAAASTSACLAGQTSCQVPVHESGWMVASADVGGIACADSAYIEVLCEFFSSEPADTLLRDTTIQRIFSELWVQSNPGNPLTGLERGGFLVFENGMVRLEPFPQAGNLCGIPHPDFLAEIAHAEAQGGEVVGMVHTHPLGPGLYPNYNRCPGATGTQLEMGQKPSPEDYYLIGLLRHYRPNAVGYIIAEGSAYDFDAGFDFANQLPDQQRRQETSRNTPCLIY